MKRATKVTAKQKIPKPTRLPEAMRSHECVAEGCRCVHFEQSEEMETACVCGHAEEEHE